MKDIEKARKAINEADKEMARLFSDRMNAVRDVAAYKAEHGLPIFDAEREAEVVARGAAIIEDEEIREYYVNFLKYTMELSKQYQHRLMSGVRVAYSGVEGAFAHIAATRIFPDGEHVSYGGFIDAYNAVVNGECDCAVLPIENSYAGEVGQVMDLMFGGSLYVSGVYNLRITHNLLGVPGARIEDIKTVISHPQALDQCAGYIRRHGFEQKRAVNTAMAAKEVAERGYISTAAIASAETAKLYGLAVLDHDINESATNTTRFAVFSRVENTAKKNVNSNFMLLFTVKNISGALAKAIDVIGRHGFNMKVLRSRPMKELAWQYYFYVEAEGDESSEKGREMLEELSLNCDMLKVVGTYSVETELKEEKL
ncbi:MAG: chorismate mutase [Clostridia bacterium]|nr:chorismate mutase [Clostridia bacterium]